MATEDPEIRTEYRTELPRRIDSRDEVKSPRQVRLLLGRIAWGAVFLLILALVGLGAPLDRESPSAGPTSLPKTQSVQLPPPPEIDPNTIDALLPRDSIQAVDDPQFEPAEQAERLADDERVIGLVINGEARAYPIPILSVHEIVNDTVGGEPVAVTWCPLCYSALVFSRRVGGQELPFTFGVSGKLLNNTLVMYDRQTDSLWSQLYGGAIQGPLSGESLAIYPSILTEWRSWREEHPDSLVLSKTATCQQFSCGTYASNPRGSYEVDPYESYYVSSDEGVVNSQIPRDVGTSTRPKKRVLGVRTTAEARAYPFDLLKEEPVINDFLGDIPVLVWFDPVTQSGLAFERRLGDQALVFGPDPTESGILLDQGTGSRWQATSGLAIDGPLRGEQLPSLVTTSAFAFGWYSYFPASSTYTPGG